MNKRKFYSVIALTLTAVMCLGAITASAAGSAPTVQNLELDTYRDVSVGGQLTAADADGDVVGYQITTQPVKGTVTLEENGKFVYAPDSGKKGKDYFGFKAQDSQGNVSQEGTVIIRICRQKAAVTYSDMAGSGEYYDAVMMAKNGIFTGEKVGETFLFSPSREVTRGEFLTMCMELSGAKLLSGVMSTGFADDRDIPAWEKPYISTAVMNGTVCGYSVTGGAVFDSGAPITQAEASVMLNKAVGLTDVASTDEAGAVPTWAAQSVANLSSHNIIPDGTVMSSSLTRGQAAQMLVKALDAVKGK